MKIRRLKFPSLNKLDRNAQISLINIDLTILSLCKENGLPLTEDLADVAKDLYELAEKAKHELAEKTLLKKWKEVREEDLMYMYYYAAWALTTWGTEQEEGESVDYAGYAIYPANNFAVKLNKLNKLNLPLPLLTSVCRIRDTININTVLNDLMILDKTIDEYKNKHPEDHDSDPWDIDSDKDNQQNEENDPAFALAIEMSLKEQQNNPNEKDDDLSMEDLELLKAIEMSMSDNDNDARISDNESVNSDSIDNMSEDKDNFMFPIPAPNLGMLAAGKDKDPEYKAKDSPEISPYLTEFHKIQRRFRTCAYSPGDISIILHAKVPSSARNNGADKVEINSRFAKYPAAKKLFRKTVVNEAVETSFTQRHRDLLNTLPLQKRKIAIYFQGIAWSIHWIATEDNIPFKVAAERLLGALLTYKTAVQSEVNTNIDLHPSIDLENVEEEKKKVWLQVDILKKIINHHPEVESLTKDMNILALASLETDHPALAHEITALYERLRTSA